MNPVRVCAEHFMEADAGVEVPGVFILVIEEVMRVLELHIMRPIAEKGCRGAYPIRILFQEFKVFRSL
jgi:hypothetical protein